MVNNDFNEFLDKQFNAIDDYIWLTSTIIYEKYKEKYDVVYYVDNFIWRNKTDLFMKPIQVNEELNLDIKKIGNILVEYNKLHNHKQIPIIVSKLENTPFVKSVKRELRELFFLPNPIHLILY
jgi:hypothetical protein